MSSNEKDMHPPSYFESIQEPSQSQTFPATPALSSTGRGSDIVDQVASVRAQNIHSAIYSHILPFVEQEAARGIAQTMIALVPSDMPLRAPEVKSEFSFDSAGEEKNVEIIDFSSDEEPRIFRLNGPSNETDFWRPQAVILELERVLSECLNASSRLRSQAIPIYKEKQRSIPPRQIKKGFFGRVADAIAQEKRSPFEVSEAEARQVDTVGPVLVKARLEEICFRTVNNFGLYDTISNQCVIVRVNARC